jgi:hypothetical protein
MFGCLARRTRSGLFIARFTQFTRFTRFAQFSIFNF